MLHNSESSVNETAVVRLYLDESGGDDPGTPQSVVGGMVINYSHFLPFEESWDGMLASHGITPPFHMKEFGKDGRLGAIGVCCKRELFAEVVDLIQAHRIAAIAATLTNAEYKQHLPEEARRMTSVHGVCFILAAMMNHHLAENNNYHGKIPFIVDIGNPCAEHFRLAVAELKRWQRAGTFLHAGGFYQDDDADFGVLQAADVIAWCVRRRASGLDFPAGMEKLSVLLEAGHNELECKAEWLKEIGGNLRKYTGGNNGK